MVSFQPTDDETAFVNVAATLANEKIRPVARDCDWNGGVDKAIQREAAELGLLSLEFPEDWDGLELPLISQVQIMKALSYGDLAVVQGFEGAGDAASVIRMLPNHPLLASYKAKLMQGSTVAFIDANDEWAGNLTIKKDGNMYTLNGTTNPVRLGKNAEFAVIVANGSAGVPVILWLNRESCNWQAEQGDYRLGLLASEVARIHFADVEVSADNVLAAGDEAIKVCKQINTRIRILQAAKETGLMEAALDYATEYTAGRKAFGREIAKFQGVSFRIATMAMETRTANHLVWQAALEADDDAESAEGMSLRALSRAHRSVRYVTNSAVQLLGGHGFVQDFPVEKWMRDAQAQVALYGRERDFLLQRGKQLISGLQEVTAQ